MMNWASKFQFLKPLTIDLNTGEAMVTALTDLMVIEVMVIAVVETVETSMGGVKPTTIISGDYSFI